MQTYMKQTMVNMQKKNKHGNMQTYMETNHGKHAKKTTKHANIHGKNKHGKRLHT